MGPPDIWHFPGISEADFEPVCNQQTDWFRGDSLRSAARRAGKEAEPTSGTAEIAGHRKLHTRPEALPGGENLIAGLS